MLINSVAGGGGGMDFTKFKALWRVNAGSSSSTGYGKFNQLVGQGTWKVGMSNKADKVFMQKHTFVGARLYLTIDYIADPTGQEAIIGDPSQSSKIARFTDFLPADEEVSFYWVGAKQDLTAKVYYEDDAIYFQTGGNPTSTAQASGVVLYFIEND